MNAISLFNEHWYLSQNPDVAEAVEDGLVGPYQHFLLYGNAEGRSPGPLFNPDEYLVRNPDVAAAVGRGEMTAYDHFMNYGITEDRKPINLFDEAFYLQQNPDVAAAVQAGSISAVEHFLQYGQYELRPINPFIDLGAYLDANPDVAGAVEAGDISAMEHLMLYGVAEGRDLGNGIELSIFADDDQFSDALDSGDIGAALARVDAVAPFLPSFVPPTGWTPPANTPIPVDFTPPEGTKLVVPDGVEVPDGTELPESFDPVTPPEEPDTPPADDAYSTKVWDTFHGIDRGLAPDGKVFVASGSENDSYATIQDAINAVNGDDIVYVGPGTFAEADGVNVNSLTGAVSILGANYSEDYATVSTPANKTIFAGQYFTGTVTIADLTVEMGKAGGITMGSDAGTFHVLNNVVKSPEGGFSAHGLGIQISGAGSTVIGNVVEIVDYTDVITDWSTSGITVTHNANGSIISNNAVTGMGKAHEGNSVTGIAVDGYYWDQVGLTNVQILENTVSNTSTGISLAFKVDATVSGNTLTGNEDGIALGSGWIDTLTIDIDGNTFSDNDKAIALYDFDGGGTITITDNTFDDMEGAIWLNDGATYAADSSMSIDLTQFNKGEHILADNVIYTGAAVGNSQLRDNIEIDEVDDEGEVAVSWSAGEFANLTLTLTGAVGYGESELADFFGVAG